MALLGRPFSVDRRDFFTTFGLGTYSLVVLADEPQTAAPQPSARPDFDRVAPANAPFASAERHMRQVTLDADVLVAGGAVSLAGIRALRDAGVSGVILGEALFTGRLDLGEALRAAA